MGIAVVPFPDPRTRSDRGVAKHPEIEVDFGAPFGGMVGRSRQLRDVFTKLERVAPCYRTALITGRTGTGKELAAHALHDMSPVSHGNFVTLNCSAVVETLFESELFGHIKGSFTDARRDKTGLIEHANGGTLFLDEVGDMPLTTQAKLLRTLQNQEVLPVGAVTPRKVDVHVVAATNKDLRAAVAAHEFREDLYYRLSMIEIEMPSLSERQGDVPILSYFFGDRWGRAIGKAFRGFNDDVMQTFLRYAWPGNIRELENVVGHACMMSSDGWITLQDLPGYMREVPAAAMAHGVTAPVRLAIPDVLSPNVTDVLEEYELRLVRQALAQTGQNQARAARILRTSRDRLRYKMKKYGLLDSPAHHTGEDDDDNPDLCA
jgi:DNA-binding NtrC family response regulator